MPAAARAGFFVCGWCAAVRAGPWRRTRLARLAARHQALTMHRPVATMRRCLRRLRQADVDVIAVVTRVDVRRSALVE